MDTVQVAERVENTLHSMLIDKGNGNPYSLSGARLYGVSFGVENTPSLSFLAEHPDIYELLDDSLNARIASGYDYTMVVTTGWAAPLNENGEVEGAPSQNPLRRRVRLAVLANPTSVASVLRFEDEPEAPITDPGDATGTLADAIRAFVASGVAQSN